MADVTGAVFEMKNGQQREIGDLTQKLVEMKKDHQKEIGDLKQELHKWQTKLTESGKVPYTTAMESIEEAIQVKYDDIWIVLLYDRLTTELGQ